VVKNGSVVSILRVSTKRGGDNEKPEAYPPRYVEDFFVGSNEVALSSEALAEGEVKPSKALTGNHFSPPC
jgi:hypothetical protein